eukprot:TRINITY_DN3712_c0_g1_i2.p1 TRINITY_DN3712_c0_g1~~TRINITY_DN3712_c0_g1_i2.p1  ORF type:complete len:169 (-),score=34.36 TRINITY_DN3712_c0_g1_i2:104-610(-)
MSRRRGNTGGRNQVLSEPANNAPPQSEEQKEDPPEPQRGFQGGSRPRPSRGNVRFGARMLFPTSGRSCFNPLPSGAEQLDRELVKKMLIRENELRLSDEVQNQFDECSMEDSEGYTQIVTKVQKQVLEENGFEPTDENLILLQSALTMYPNDSELKQLLYTHSGWSGS